MTAGWSPEQGSRPRRQWLLAGAAIVVCAVAVLVVVSRWGWSAAPRMDRIGTAPASSPAASEGRSDGAAPFGPASVAALDRAHALAVDLVRLGERQSRNMLEITAAQRRMEDQLGTVDALFAGQTPPSLVPSVRSYRQGASRIKTAIRDARDGFLQFDWERVAGAREMLAEGTADLERSLAQARLGG